MEIAIERLVALCYFVVGISHLAHPRTWAEFFVSWQSKGNVGSLLNGLLNFPLGAVIVCFHNVWHGPAILVTVLGWVLVIKGIVYLIFPAFGRRRLARVSVDRSWEFVAAGIFSILLSAAIFWLSLR
jgi:uncharacterized membrane protein HdeD (DUF308 family)